MTMAIRSILSVPGHRPSMIARARTRGADQIAWDLEDSVPRVLKMAALRNVLKVAMPGDAVRFCRETTPWHVVVALGQNGVQINVPKVETGHDIEKLRELITDVRLLAVVESVQAVRNIDSICAAADAIAFGRADFCASVGSENCLDLIESAMGQISMAAMTAGIPAYDSPCEMVNDDLSMRWETSRAVSFGFAGKICIHPAQIAECRTFNHEAQPELAGRIGSGATMLDGRLCAEPHYKLAEKIMGVR